jgi:hypothetical protein
MALISAEEGWGLCFMAYTYQRTIVLIKTRYVTLVIQEYQCLKLKDKGASQCHFCVAHRAYDSCRFVGIRQLRFVNGRVKEERLVSNRRHIELQLPLSWNVDVPSNEQIASIKVKIIYNDLAFTEHVPQRTVADALLPILKEELAHISRPDVLVRTQEVTIRATCGTYLWCSLCTVSCGAFQMFVKRRYFQAPGSAGNAGRKCAAIATPQLPRVDMKIQTCLLVAHGKSTASSGTIITVPSDRHTSPATSHQFRDSIRYSSNTKPKLWRFFLVPLRRWLMPRNLRCRTWQNLCS